MWQNEFREKEKITNNELHNNANGKKRGKEWRKNLIKFDEIRDNESRNVLPGK